MRTIIRNAALLLAMTAVVRAESALALTLGLIALSFAAAMQWLAMIDQPRRIDRTDSYR